MKITNQDLLSDTPFVAVDLEVMERNIKWLSKLARENNIKLRPHTKTHKSPYIAQLQINAGASGITTATLGEAEVMADSGITNILIAFPILGERKLDRFRRLHERVEIIVSFDDIAVAEELNKIGKLSEKPVSVYIDVDCGLGRMGRTAKESIVSIKDIAKLPFINVIGLMSHAGQAYKEDNEEKIKEIAVKEAETLHDTRVALKNEGIDIKEISVGSTATARFIKDIPYITEKRAGMYVFNDRLIMNTGGAREMDCALTVIATVVSHPADDRLIIDAGSKTLSSDQIKGGGYGKIKGHDNLLIEHLSEEHGIVKIKDQNTNLQVGDVIEIIPNHVCPVVNLTDEVYAFRQGRLERVIYIEGRGKNR